MINISFDNQEKNLTSDGKHQSQKNICQNTMNDYLIQFERTNLVYKTNNTIQFEECNIILKRYKTDYSTFFYSSDGGNAAYLLQQVTCYQVDCITGVSQSTVRGSNPAS